MELVGIIGFFVLVAVIAFMFSFVIDRANQREVARKREAAIKEAKSVRWEVVTTTSVGDVMIALRRHRDLLVVAKIPNGAKDWEDRVIAAQAEAAQRAAILNAEV